MPIDANAHTRSGGSASADTSGTPRLLKLAGCSPAVRDLEPFLPSGKRKEAADAAAAGILLLAPSFQTTSLAMLPLATRRLVPPHARPMRAGSREVDVIRPVTDAVAGPAVARRNADGDPQRGGAWSAWSKAVIACLVQDDSGPPQLMEMTEGLLLVS